MTSNGSVETAREEILRIAGAMLSGEIDLIVGSRKICELRYVIGEPDNPVFNPIIGFESETDDYPLGPIRARFSKDYLQKLDQEIRAYVERARPGVLVACKRIIESLGGR